MHKREREVQWPARTAPRDPGPCVTRSPLVFLYLQVPNRLLSLALLPPHLCTGLHSDFPPQGQLPAAPSRPPTRRCPHPFTSEQLPTPSLCYTQHLKVSLSRRSHSRMEFPFVPIKAQLNAFFSPTKSLGHHKPIWISIFSSTKNWQKL